MSNVLEKLQTEAISRRAFDSLDEYSCSQPTGVVVGKVWKASPIKYPAFWPPELRQYSWIICEYVSCSDEMCRVDVRIPLIRE